MMILEHLPKILRELRWIISKGGIKALTIFGTIAIFLVATLYAYASGPEFVIVMTAALIFAAILAMFVRWAMKED